MFSSQAADSRCTRRDVTAHGDRNNGKYGQIMQRRQKKGRSAGNASGDLRWRGGAVNKSRDKFRKSAN